jgi:hypothetical protein
MSVTLLTSSEEGKVELTAVTRDFSLGGLSVRTTIPVWPCQRVEIKLADEFRSLTSRVAWISASGGRPEGAAGLMFFSSLPSELVEAGW